MSHKDQPTTDDRHPRTVFRRRYSEATRLEARLAARAAAESAEAVRAGTAERSPLRTFG